MRLDYFLAHAAGFTRKEAKSAVAGRRVTVNGEPVLKANHKVPDDATICLDGEKVVLEGPRYYMFFKPKDAVCATEDADHRTVLDCLPDNIRKDLKIVGRLDKDTTGLLLLTTDGDWLHRITSPKRECGKTYLVDLAMDISDSDIEQLVQGVQLHGESHLTRPATVTRHSSRQISLTISEGKYHQVKRMLAAVGNRVIDLHRTQIGGVALDAALRSGEFRPLTASEIASF